MTQQEYQIREALKQAKDEADGDLARVVIVKPGTYLVINQPGFDPNTWPKTDWKD